MNNGDSLEQQALASAKQYMGGVAWPTVCYALVVFFSYGLVLASALAGALSLWIATPIVMTLTYLSYTVLHEAVHGTITGGQQSLRWINEALGYIAGWILMTPLTAHRHEHLAHHRNTNDEHEDPDYHISQIGNSPIESFRSALHIVHIQLSPLSSASLEQGAGATESLLLCGDCSHSCAQNCSACCRLLVRRSNVAGCWLAAGGGYRSLFICLPGSSASRGPGALCRYIHCFWHRRDCSLY